MYTKEEVRYLYYILMKEKINLCLPFLLTTSTYKASMESTKLYGIM